MLNFSSERLVSNTRILKFAKNIKSCIFYSNQQFCFVFLFFEENNLIKTFEETLKIIVEPERGLRVCDNYFWEKCA